MMFRAAVERSLRNHALAALLGLAGASAVVAGIAGCPAAVAPAIDCGSRIAVDAAQGMGLTQILADVTAPCALDLAAIVAALLSSADPKVTASKAYREAVQIVAAGQAAQAAQKAQGR